MRMPIVLALLSLVSPALAAPPTGDDVAWQIVEGITTEVGQRLAGTEAEARARTWAVARLKALGFANVHVEAFDMPVWVRAAESAEIVAPYPQRLVVTALGGSGATTAAGMTAPVVRFGSLAELQAAPAAAIAGRIVFVDHAMQATMDGSAYSYFGKIRRNAPAIAARNGALAVLVRSIGSDRHRLPHTGQTVFPADVPPIPAAALSAPDADQLDRLLARGGAVAIHLLLTPRRLGTGPSGNVIAEIPGRDPKLPIVAVGGHLDSWDLGTGAIDDGAGLAIATAAAKRLLDGPRPLRTVRLVWFGAEEPGVLGGAAYAKRHAAEPHALTAEADAGAGRIWQYRVAGRDISTGTYAAIAAALEPLGIAPSAQVAAPEDFDAIAKATGAATIGLAHDMSRYFEIHHSADDTLDKINRDDLDQAVDAWTAMLTIAANAPVL